MTRWDPRCFLRAVESISPHGSCRDHAFLESEQQGLRLNTLQRRMTVLDCLGIFEDVLKRSVAKADEKGSDHLIQTARLGGEAFPAGFGMRCRNRDLLVDSRFVGSGGEEGCHVSSRR